MILYIAGPMTGLPDLNFRAFFDAEAALREKGYDVRNPARNDCIGWLPCMRAALRQISEVDGMALLLGWEHSSGARIERSLADQLGFPVKRIDQWLDTKEIKR